jgi:hypothetical protein
MDIDLLHLVKSRDKFVRFKPFIKDHVLSKEALLIYNTMDLYFRHYPQSQEISFDAFETYFFIERRSAISKDSNEVYRRIFDNLKSYTPSSSSGMPELLLEKYVTDDYATRIGDASLRVREGRAKMDEIDTLLSEYEKELGKAMKPEDIFITGGVASTVGRARNPGYDWRLRELNIGLGPVRQGDFILLAAYVGTGKTTLAASEVSFMAQQIKDNRPVIWVNNEEESSKVLVRIMQATLGWTMADIQADLPKAETEYERLMGMKNRILVTDNDTSRSNVQHLNNILRSYNPAIIVFDQLDKVAGFEREADGREYERLGRVYKWARELSHQYGPVIAITQCDGSSEGQKYIHMNQLRGSKVDKPAEADAIITVGKSNDPADRLRRFIHVPKNKLAGGPISLEAEREGYFEVSIQPEIARYAGTR